MIDKIHPVYPVDPVSMYLCCLVALWFKSSAWISASLRLCVRSLVLPLGVFNHRVHRDHGGDLRKLL